MRHISTLVIVFITLSLNVTAQPIIAGGFGTTGLGLVNGTSYTKTGTLGSGGYAFVSASNDGSRFYSTSPTKKLLFIDVASSTFVDSMDINLRNLASSNETNTLFSINTQSLIRINTSTKTVTDSVVLGAPWQLTERPGAKEVWVSDSGKIHVVDYTAGLVVSTFSVAPSPYDYAAVSFNPAGTFAFKAAGTTRKLFKIDASTKAIITSVNTSPVVPAACAVSHDGSKLFVNDATNIKVMIYSTSDLSLIDSIVLNKVPMNIYRHPTRNEMWVVHHFSDSVSVYDENTKALIASFGVSGSPWYMAFGVGTTKVNDVKSNDFTIKIYPNPAADHIAITGLSGNDGVNIFDLAGKQVLTFKAENKQTTFDITSLKTGYYLVYITDELGNKTSIPLIKQ